MTPLGAMSSRAKAYHNEVVMNSLRVVIEGFMYFLINYSCRNIGVYR